MFTANPPIASIGCRTVVSEGAANADSATSSNPVTEQCSGTLTPAFVNARIAPSAVRSSNAMTAVNFFFCVAISALKAGIRIERIRQLQYQPGIDLQARALRKFLYSTPTRCAVDQHLWPPDEHDSAVAELI